VEKEVGMPRTGRWVVVFLVVGVLAGGSVALAEGVAFSGGVDLVTTFTPILLLSYDISSELTLSLSLTGFTFETKTGFSLAGFQSERIEVGFDLGAVEIGEEVLFNPAFSWNELSVDVDILGVLLGLDLLLANIGTPQTPDFSVGIVLQLESTITCGLTLTTLTGFGAVDLVNLIGGIEAPFSNQVLALTLHLDQLFAPPEALNVTVVPGIYFEEEVLRLQLEALGILLSTSTWFDWTGFSQEILEFGYHFDEPPLALLSVLTVDSDLAVSELDLFLDLQIGIVRFTSETFFSEPSVPLPIPLLFSGQDFALGIAWEGIGLVSEIEFDDLFLFERERFSIEVVIDPVSVASLTEFDATGFVGEWIRAGVQVGGVVLFTEAAFDVGGVTSVSFGFELRF
jgi:hypothetical protein